MDIKVILQGTESTLRVLLSQSGQELAELLCINALLESHIEINSLADRDCKNHCDRFDLVHTIINLERSVLNHPGTILIVLGGNDELIKIHHLVALFDHKIIGCFECDNTLLDP